MDYLQLTVDKLSVDSISELVVDDSCGAVSVFVGTTRDNFEGKKVLRLEYEAYEPMAIKALKGICDEIRTKWPSVFGIAIYHRLGLVPTREASVVIAISSPHRKESLEAVSHCIDQLKASVPIWKKEIYEGCENNGVWKENKECESNEETVHSPQSSVNKSLESVDKNLIQINVSSEELQQRITNFIDRKREQINVSNIEDFIPSKAIKQEVQDADAEISTCARVRTQFVKRSDSKGHLKVHKVTNEWGPQTVHQLPVKTEKGAEACSLPPGISERVLDIEKFLHISPVSPDVYKRLKDMETKIAILQSVSPEYAHFWGHPSQRQTDNSSHGGHRRLDFIYGADEISKKIEKLERQFKSNG